MSPSFVKKALNTIKEKTSDTTAAVKKTASELGSKIEETAKKIPIKKSSPKKKTTAKKKPATKKTTVKKPAAKKTAAKKAATKKTAAKKPAAKKTTAKKPAAKKPAAKKTATKKPATKKPAAKKAAAKKPAAKKTTAKKPAAKKSATKKPATKKTSKAKTPFASYKGPRSYAFISYAHKDMTEVFGIIKKLHSIGVRIWYDEGIEPGNEWPEVIGKALINSAQVIVFMSPYATASRNCRNEINLAFSENKDILVIMLRPTEMSHGMKLQMGTVQQIVKDDFNPKVFIEKVETGVSPKVIES